MLFGGSGSELNDLCIKKGNFVRLQGLGDREIDALEPVEIPIDLIDLDSKNGKAQRTFSITTKKEKGIPECGFTKCDDPEFRDRYQDLINKNIKLEWLVYGSRNDTIEKMIQIATYDINQRFDGVGIEFISFVQFFQLFQDYCKTVLPKIRYAKSEDACFFDDSQDEEFKNVIPCFNSIKMLTKVHNMSWQKRGAIQIVLGDPVEKKVVGYSATPWKRLNGFIFVSIHRIQFGYSTLAHELGHTLGLVHTFQGYSKNKCTKCQEVDKSDTTGDFVSDTPPIPKNWDCSDPDIKKYPDPCNKTRTAWISTPYKNLMSYGPHSCRITLSPQQKRRIRCYIMNMGRLFQ